MVSSERRYVHRGDVLRSSPVASFAATTPCSSIPTGGLVRNDIPAVVPLMRQAPPLPPSLKASREGMPCPSPTSAAQQARPRRKRHCGRSAGSPGPQSTSGFVPHGDVPAPVPWLTKPSGRPPWVTVTGARAVPSPHPRKSHVNKKDATPPEEARAEGRTLTTSPQGRGRGGERRKDGGRERAMEQRASLAALKK